MFHAAALLVAATCAAPASAAAVATDREVVRVNGVAIRQSEVVDRLWKRYGPQTLDDMIDELLLRQAAVAGKVKPEESEVDRRFARLQAQFGSRELLVSQLEQAGTTVAKVKEDLADEITREKLISSAKGVKVTDDELKKAFDENKDKLGKPEAAHLRHILVADDKAAADVIAKVKAGGDFEKLAREKSIAASGKAAGGDYGFVSRGMLPPEIDEVAFAMAPGEMKMIAGPRGTHILQVLEKRAAQPAVFAEVKEDLREMLTAEKIKAAAPAYLQELRRKAEIKTPSAQGSAAPATKKS